MNYGDLDYNTRNTITVNSAEQYFVEWAERRCSLCVKIGFDEKKDRIENFFHINPILRNLPDFLIVFEDKIYIVNVKGTNKIKDKEMRLLPEMIKSYSSEKALLIYAFCFKDYDPIFMTTEKLTKLYEEGEPGKWPDGITYRAINLNHI